MYISNLKLTNIKCFKDFEIDFKVPDENSKVQSPQWTMILGDNNAGKTSILKSIVLGLSDIGQANQLKTFWGNNLINYSSEKFNYKEITELQTFKKQVPSKNIAEKTRFGNIKLQLKNQNTNFITLQTLLFEDEQNNESIISADYFSDENSQEVIDYYLKKERLFLCAYGARRSTKGYDEFERDYKDYNFVKAVESLFKDDSQLGNLDNYLGRTKEKKRQRYNNIVRTLEFLFWPESFNSIISEKISDDFSIHHHEGEFYIKEKLGTEKPLQDYGDGYRGLSSWILDLYGWALVSKKSNNEDKIAEGKNLSGVVIIDELEQHLHPAWQRRIVKDLSQAFPKIQFITTTHSPLVAAGITDIENAKLVVLKGDGKYVTLEPDDIRGYRADEILVSNLFNLSASTPISFEEDLKNYKEYLISGKLKNKTSNEIKELEKRINQSKYKAEELKAKQKEDSETLKLLKKIEKAFNIEE